MHRIVLSLAILLATTATASATVKVVATVPDLASITKEIGGKHVKVTALTLRTQDPHFADAKPSLVLKLNKADLLVAVGLDLEIGWLPSLQTQARNSKIASGGSGFLDCSTVVDIRGVPDAAVDRSSGDVHPLGNPHYLYDPRQAAKCAKAIADKLADLDPDHAKAYAKNLAAFVKSLDAARKDWEQRIAAHAGAPVVVYHESMTYLIDWLGLDQVAALEPKPGIPPTAQHVARVIKSAKARSVKVVLQETYYPDKTGKLVAKKIGATIVKLPGGADVAKGQTYADHMEEFIADLEAALQ